VETRHVPIEVYEITNYRSLLQLVSVDKVMDDKAIERALELIEIEFRAERISSEMVYHLSGILCNGH